MSDPSEPLQIGVAAALLGATAVTGLVDQAVYDPLGGKDVYPRIDVGDCVVLDDSTSCDDDAEAELTLHVWARGPAGRLLAKRIAAASAAVLTPHVRSDDAPYAEPFPVSGFAITAHAFVSSRSLDDPDGKTAHSVVTLRFSLRPAA